MNSGRPMLGRCRPRGAFAACMAASSSPYRAQVKDRHLLSTLSHFSLSLSVKLAMAEASGSSIAAAAPPPQCASSNSSNLSSSQSCGGHAAPPPPSLLRSDSPPCLPSPKLPLPACHLGAAQLLRRCCLQPGRPGPGTATAIRSQAPAPPLCGRRRPSPAGQIGHRPVLPDGLLCSVR